MPNPVIVRRALANAGAAISTVTSNWAARVQINGGTAPSQATIVAVDTFYKGLVADGIDTLIVALNVFAPDNLIAAITPLIVGPGLDPWTNTNFVAGDLSTAGLKDTNVNRWLNTGINPNTAYPDNNSFGISWYARSTDNNGNNMRVYAVSGDTAALTTDGTNFYFGAYADWNLGPIAQATNFTAGTYVFLSGSRTASNAAAMYGANGSVSFRTLGTTAGATAARPNLNIYAYCANNAGTPAFFPPPGFDPTCSFICFHLGMTSAQTQALFNRTQTLRQTFGGGYT